MTSEATDFLIATELCNVDHSDIQRCSARITRGLDTDEERASALFRFVRDGVRYRLGLYRHSAAETLARGSGSCSNKANLLVALLRAAGIRAGFHVMQVKTKEYFGPLCHPRFHRYLSNRSIHVYCSVFLHGHWVKCDPSDDAALSEATAHINPQSRSVDFDGTCDATLRIDPEHVLCDDPVCRPSIDDLLSKTCRKSSVFLKVLDGYLDYMREYGRQYECAESLSTDFLASLRNRFPEGYALFATTGAAVV